MTAPMERVRRICRHPLFVEQTALLEEAERDRIFCRHTMEHLLDVARIMYIYALEDGCSLSRELVYAAALLHDIGRYEQITEGTPHHTAGARMAGEILPACGFSEEETARIRTAIEHHRAPGPEGIDPLPDYLYRADKQSRCCFHCSAADQCNWPQEKKNHFIQY